MLYVSFYHVRHEQLDRLRTWMKDLKRRRAEALESYQQEGVRHELAYLLEGREGPVLVYIAEVGERDKARSAYLASKLPIDLEHREVMREVVCGREKVEVLYECIVDE